MLSDNIQHQLNLSTSLEVNLSQSQSSRKPLQTQTCNVQQAKSRRTEWNRLNYDKKKDLKNRDQNARSTHFAEWKFVKKLIYRTALWTFKH